MRYSFYWAVLFALAVSLQCACGYGQPREMKDLKKSTPEQRAAFQTNLMKTKLNLSTAQVSKVQSINLKYAEKFQPLITGSDSRFSKMQQAMALQKQKDQELQTVFNKQQFSTYQAFEQGLRSKLRAAYKQ